MRYMLMIYNDESALANAPKEAMGQMMAAFTAYTEAMRKSGAYVASDRLGPAAAGTIVRGNGNGKTKVLNGPYAEAKEQLGGYYIVDVPDIDAALGWASRCPIVPHGAVEVRPIMTM